MCHRGPRSAVTVTRVGVVVGYLGKKIWGYGIYWGKLTVYGDANIKVGDANHKT